MKCCGFLRSSNPLWLFVWYSVLMYHVHAYDGDSVTVLPPIPLGDVQPAILGGYEAKEGEFPYQASMIRYNQHWCGASILSQNYILTASHCATNMEDDGGYTEVPAEDISVRVGSIDRNSGGVVVGVAKVIVHPQYNFPNYDVTLLQLNTSLEFTPNIQPIPLAETQPPINSKVNVSGWGLTSTNGEPPETLLATHVRTISDRQCTIALNAIYNTTWCGRHDIAHGICQGDSGGPAAHNGYLLGVISFTPGPCESTIPDGFAKITVLRDWIIENSDLNEDN